jgi:hypothetical protein
MAAEIYIKSVPDPSGVGTLWFGKRIRFIDQATAEAAVLAGAMKRIVRGLYTAIGVAPMATVTGLPAAPAGTALITLDFHSSPAAKAYTATVVYTLGAAADQTFTVACAAGDTGNAFATKLAAAPGWPANLATAKGVGATVDVTNNHGSDLLTKLLVTFA